MSKDIRLFCIEHGIDLDELGPVGEISDGSHTFDDLYHQRAVLFAALCNVFPNYSWKSWRHHDGEKCFGADDWFIVGIETPEGQYTYHYQEKYWDMFKCQEVDHAPEWDGHMDKDVERLLSLGSGYRKSVADRTEQTYLEAMRAMRYYSNELEKRPELMIDNLVNLERVNALSKEDAIMGIDLAKRKDFTGRIAPGFHLPVMDGPGIRIRKESLLHPIDEIIERQFKEWDEQKD